MEDGKILKLDFKKKRMERDKKVEIKREKRRRQWNALILTFCM